LAGLYSCCNLSDIGTNSRYCQSTLCLAAGRKELRSLSSQLLGERLHRQHYLPGHLNTVVRVAEPDTWILSAVLPSEKDLSLSGASHTSGEEKVKSSLKISLPPPHPSQQQQNLNSSHKRHPPLLMQKPGAFLLKNRNASAFSLSCPLPNICKSINYSGVQISCRSKSDCSGHCQAVMTTLLKHSLGCTHWSQLNQSVPNEPMMCQTFGGSLKGNECDHHDHQDLLE
jgi:hypothetical protein